jgi:hypothetical protein
MRRRSVCRHVQFEALEERITMSGGLAHSGVAAGEVHSPPALAAPAHPDALFGAQAHSRVVPAAKKFVPVKGTLSGGPTTVLEGDYFVVGGLSGKLGKVGFSGHADGFFSGNTFKGGYIVLSNSQGSITANLAQGTFATKGKTTQVKVSVVFQDATGAYSLTAGSAGVVTLKFSSAKSQPKAIPDLSFQGMVAINIVLSSPDTYDKLFGEHAHNPFGNDVE